MAKKNHELTEGEWAIITAVWDNEPDRMVTKGLLRTERIRNLILYRSAITRKQAQSGEIMRAVKRAFDGALTPMMQFMLDNNLSQEQLDELERLIKKKRVGGATSGAKYDGPD
ncbi:MAG: hypothetical protein AMJ65_18060 [Phycisphaerae bacterium SG8_4]|nr:MAG: hypothetical protein AMJ65_18060 [Phycisphaerae bacterium SG8_4]